LESSALAIFVNGAVLRPGKIMTDRPITALEAIMEAGGFDHTRANLKAVRVIRHEGGQVKNYTLNLKPAFQGKSSEPFYLKRSDIVYVPERFSVF
jgi:polysaccharide export outer membrane protein